MSNSLNEVRSEIRKHKQRVSKEEKRHKEEMKNIWKESKLSDMYEKTNELNQRHKEIKSLLGKTRDLICEFIYDSVKNKSFSLDNPNISKRVTIRDVDVFEYNTSNKAPISRVLGSSINRYRLMKNIEDAERRSVLKEVIGIWREAEKLENFWNLEASSDCYYEQVDGSLVVLELDSTKFYVCSKDFNKNPEETIRQINSVEVINPEGAEVINLRGLRRDMHNVSSSIYERYKSAYVNREKIDYLIEQVSKTISEQKSLSLNVYNNISNVLSKYIISKRI